MIIPLSHTLKSLFSEQAELSEHGTTLEFRICITVVPNKSVGGNFFLKINKTVGDLLNKMFRIRTCRREKQPKNNKISNCLIRTEISTKSSLKTKKWSSKMPVRVPKYLILILQM